MLKIENTEVFGWEAAIRGMRNPLNSWAKSDSHVCMIDYGMDCQMCENGHEPALECDDGKRGFCIGNNDLALMKKLSAAGTDHSKFLRMIMITCDIVAPTFWWAEYDTYKVSTVRNSCSKMHKIHVKPFYIEDFTCEGCLEIDYAREALMAVVAACERLRKDFNETQDKKYWRALIELLPEGYNLRATVQFSYENAKHMHRGRRHHKLTEWHTFCDWLEILPYFMEICVNGD